MGEQVSRGSCLQLIQLIKLMSAIQIMCACFLRLMSVAKAVASCLAAYVCLSQAVGFSLAEMAAFGCAAVCWQATAGAAITARMRLIQAPHLVV